jgi:hypothetical protein
VSSGNCGKRTQSPSVQSPTCRLIGISWLSSFEKSLRPPRKRELVEWTESAYGARPRNASVSATMYVVLNAVVPRLVMPITIMLTIVIAFLIPLSIAPVMDYLSIVYYAA